MRVEVQLALIIGMGILSRTVHTGWIILDKYAGDALYAAVVYTLLSLITSLTILRKSLLAMLIMTALELFQLTLIPAHMLQSSHLFVRLAARLLGTQFSLLDLVSYAVGIAASMQMFRPSQIALKVPEMRLRPQLNHRLPKIVMNNLELSPKKRPPAAGASKYAVVFVLSRLFMAARSTAEPMGPYETCTLLRCRAQDAPAALEITGAAFRLSNQGLTEWTRR